ncbi:4-hydroxyphenylacetate 3-hydroxylase family protein [Mycobacteroides abscessus]|uniref:4-hydroxyphenylacetate 3-hydroxylase family protein n=1 Tax=Mycobacteroides abscessus TaxID=36809 RepID=UPI0009A8BB6E|nr:4-hydroxyphenylacetate 3-hydroxylase N-terminal domain-containing protein [Mycobacteroides abscessus]MDO3069536.1 4-hydroxyphenylacetate 3-hydroxylase N-terminal domain-containing protein [Mycobacteroides abscessus subsp. bolletii]SKN92109.1 4-hydroxyphenylacetate 3-monooxygenase oxygenase subunit [Mycobacteroides abscessus subsp. bolletii]SKX20252.1 4-hydroxyphenylacetate 3-monooxygenase oxygenase subunit [Mycobacteroides abscessus subsp. bolletii]
MTASIEVTRDQAGLTSPVTGSPPRGLQTSSRYLSELNDGRAVWLNGEKIANVAEHPAFEQAARELGRLFDLQHSPELADLLTVEAQGRRIATAYQLPTTIEHLRAKRRNADVWMHESWGLHGRSPAFMSTIGVGLYDFRNRLATNRPEFGVNAENYYRHLADNDLVLAHALGDPQIDRSATPLEDEDLALRVVSENSDGIVVRGAKQLTTLAPYAHEVLVYLSASFTNREADRFVVWFGIPVATEGLTVLSREPLGHEGFGHAHPFGKRFDEQDSMLFFDDVLVPWERVLLLRDGQLAREGLGRINAWSQYVGQVRFRERLQSLLSVGIVLAESIGVDGFRNIQEDLGELASYVEILDHFIDAGEATAQLTDGGLLAPGATPAAAVWAAQIAPRCTEIVRRVGSAGILMQPTEADLSSPLRPYLDRYMRGKTLPADDKSRLFRLAWDLTADSFGSRQDLYEFVHRGDITRNRINLLRRHQDSRHVQRVRDVIKNPLQASATTAGGQHRDETKGTS